MGWAWEFIRRSPAYRDVWRSFQDYRELQGSNWYKKQKAEHPYPPLMKGETLAAWRQRAMKQLFVAEMLTGSKLVARQWNLADLYDPQIQYTPDLIRFVFPTGSAPMMYAYNIPSDSEYLNVFADIEADLRHIFNNGAVVAVFDPHLPMEAQIKRYKAAHKAASTQLAANKLPHTHWIKIIQVLDAWDAKTALTMTDIARAVGVKGEKEVIVKAAHDLKAQALDMISGGYKRLLANLNQAASV